MARARYSYGTVKRQYYAMCDSISFKEYIVMMTVTQAREM